ncbi:MAG: hypothetical protein J7K88_12445 [Candidatus Fermentibacteraceae bacterium]|nr:hypothetical protein [Candidatus Fermentibacteraceae bacterium]
MAGEIVRALGAISGGLDGMLACRVLMDQGIRVEAITFNSPFFDAEAGKQAAVVLGIPWREVDFTVDIVNLLFDPPSGFGKNMNPCIDCHAAMFGKLKDIAVAEGFDFIFTGEVVGQRPMSQNRGSLNRVRNISSTNDILLRPLSAKILDPTPMEQEGLVDREKLLDLNGRGRSRQLEMAKDYGFSSVPSPGGGCLLTDPGYANRLRVLRDIGLLNGENARMIRTGRMFVLDGAVGLVGRSSDENDRMLEAGTGIQLDIQGIPGPLGVLIGKNTAENLTLLTAIMASYTKATGPVTAVVISGGNQTFTTERISSEDRSRYMVTL